MSDVALTPVRQAHRFDEAALAAYLEGYLSHESGLSCTVLSIDDLYLTRAARQALGQSVHPLLETRGVPGTHDVALGLAVIDGQDGAGDAQW